MIRTLIWHPRCVLLAALTLIACAACPNSALAAKPVTWNKNFDAACKYAKKADRLILAYFSGSDWDEWGKKLQKEVLSSDNFANWADKNVIIFNADFPGNTRQDLFKKQNEDLKVRYQVSVVPTFLLLDADGEVVARATYENLKLLPSEPVGHPQAAIDFLDGIVKNRPETEKLVVQPSIEAANANAKAHKLPVLLLLTKPDPIKPPTPMLLEADKLVQNQRFIRWCNINVSFIRAKWSDSLEKTADGALLNEMILKFKLGPADAQLIMYVPGEETFRSRALAFNANDMAPMMTRLTRDLPLIAYKGTDWLNDVRLARAILSQQNKREMFLYFTDGSEFCKKIEEEIFQKEEFSTWPFFAFVFVRLDYTKGVERPKWLDDQNRSQADLYGIRGYPYVVLVNPKGQKIGEAKYLKGGPKPFLAELKKVYDKDIERRILIGADDVVQPEVKD